MGGLFAFRTQREPWGGSRGLFLFPIEVSVNHLKRICPKWGDEFQDILDNFWLGRCFFLESTSLEEEKHVLEAIKLGYQDCLDNPEDCKSKYFRDPDYFDPYLAKYKKLIDLIKEEIRDIERGKLILQEDGSAIINEDFKED